MLITRLKIIKKYILKIRRENEKLIFKIRTYYLKSKKIKSEF